MSSTNKRRFNKTLKMLKSVVPNGSSIFDLGVRNEFSKIMTTNGYKVFNNTGEDLDLNFNFKIPNDVDIVTGFEILEHLVSPYPLLKNLKCKKLCVTVPLRLWFSSADRN